MSLKAQIQSDLTAAMKARDAVTTSTLRMLRAAIGNAEVAGTEAIELTNEQTLDVLRAEAKKRAEAAKVYDDAGRAESAAKEQSELAIIERYLPAAMGDDELAQLVAEETAARCGCRIRWAQGDGSGHQGRPRSSRGDGGGRANRGRRQGRTRHVNVVRRSSGVDQLGLPVTNEGVPEHREHCRRESEQLDDRHDAHAGDVSAVQHGVDLVERHDSDCAEADEGEQHESGGQVATPTLGYPPERQ